MNQQPETYNEWRLLFEQREPLEIDPRSTALLIIDMQYYDAHPDYGMGAQAREMEGGRFLDYYWQQVDRIVPRIRELAEVARRSDMRVIYSRIEALTRSCDDISLLYKLCNIRVPVNSKEAEVLEELAPQEDDIVLSKTTSSVFNSTVIHQLLRNLKIETLITAGVVLSGCVESSVRDAADLGYRVVLVTDACADLSPEIHAASMSNLDRRYAQGRTTAEVLELIGAAAPAARG